MPNPYGGLPNYAFWSRSMAWPAPGAIDPVTNADFKIKPADKIATLGSCFAQHVSRHLQKSGFNYFVPEEPPDYMRREDAARNNFGTFSARYGNVYTVRQAVQLVERAFGEFDPIDVAWERGARYVDPFRPQIEPDGFASPEEVVTSRETHLAAVRRVLIESDIIVFTLGLTEGWRSRVDGAVFPLAPGVAGGNFDPLQHEFVNFDVLSVIRDLEAFCRRVQSFNPRARIILTVSPVPLIATYEDRHVLVSTVSSKSILRVAAEEVERRLKRVTYFPSYEIITAPGLSERYYESDLREVKALGVQHVMRVFEKHYVAGSHLHDPVAAMPPKTSLKFDSGIICDEEVIERSVAT